MNSTNSSVNSEARRKLTLRELAQVGFAAASAAQAQFDELPESVAGVLQDHLDSFRAVADPDAALHCLARLSESQEAIVLDILLDDERRDPFVRVLGITSAAVEFFIRNPEELQQLTFAGLPTTAELESAFGAVLDGDIEQPGWQAKATRALRVVYRRMRVRIIAVDVSADDPRDIVADISDALARIADRAVDTALSIARLALTVPTASPRWKSADVEATRLAIIAMGKTGAEELNYISDVDVIYVGQSADTEILSEERALTIATKLAIETQRGIEGYGVEPPLWPIDANLRPEGKDGALVRTLSSHIAYYERWAKGWEFQAQLKARPMAGDLALGEAYCAALSPIVWAAASAPDFVSSVQRMRERVMSFIPQEEVDRQLKLGPGGIRDIEFTVQLLQLVHGQHDERIRNRATLEALRSLAEYGYIGRTEAQQFGLDYRSLRMLEHRVQLRHMQRTHLMPVSEDELRVLARSTGHMRTHDEVEQFWRRLRHDVRMLHEQLFFRPLLAAVATLPGESFSLTSDRAEARLAAVGFRDPAGALVHIGALTKGLSRRSEIQRHLLPIMLKWFGEGTDPDYALLSFRSLSEGAGQSYWYLRMLRDSRFAARRLATILSTSRLAADQLVRMPQHVAWLGSDEEMMPKPFEEIKDAMAQAIARHPDNLDAAKQQIWMVRRKEVLRTAVAAISDLISSKEIGQALSNIATAELQCALAIEAPNYVDIIEFGAIAMGRFGGAEMGFSSDVDLMYVYRALPGVDTQLASTTAIRLVGSIGKFVNDPVYPMEIDLGLRPEGKSGAVARSLGAYEKYYARWSAIWESQALLRARAVAGSPNLLNDFIELIEPIRYPRVIASKQIREIRKIKARVESERLPRGTDPKRHFKLGLGSISDVEWMVQLLQLQHGAQDAALRTTSTLQALRACANAGYIGESDAETLRAAWILASRARSAATLAFGRTTDVLPSAGDQLEAIARILGYPTGSAFEFENDYLRTTRMARQVFERLFYGEPLL